MSALRIDSLRLVWLEAFLEVTEAENISAAARAMGVNQSTVSRYMQALEKWSGKTLLQLKPVEDEKAGPMTRMTDDGIALLQIVQDFVPQLRDFRTPEALRDELLEDIAAIIDTLVADLEGSNPSSVIKALREQVEFAAAAFPQMLEAPMTYVETAALGLRVMFKRYEWELKRERRFNRAKAKPGKSTRHIKVPPSPAS